MRGVNGVIFCGRAIRIDSTTISAIASGTTHHRLPQLAPSGTCFSANPQWLSHKLIDPWRYQAPLLLAVLQGHVLLCCCHLSQSTRPSKDIVLYQYEACPFCNKVKAFLDYYNIPYKFVEVNPINKKKIKWSNYKKVPILTVDGERMVDSSDIIDKFLIKMLPDYDLNNDGEKWRGLAMYFVSKNRKFLGGSDPNLADLAMFGVLRPNRHLKSGRDMIKHTLIG